MGAMGLAIGATVGTMIHSVIICVIVLRTDWLGEVARAASRVHSKGGAENTFGRLKFDEEAAAAAVAFQAGRCAVNHANAPQFIHHVLDPMLFCGLGSLVDG